MISIMQTKTQWSSNTYVPYLKEADDSHLSKASMGQQLEYGNKYIICKNNEYVVCEAGAKAVLETWPIRQNEEGIDMEDRIIVLKQKIV